MGFEAFIVNNLFQLLGAAIILGGGWYSLKNITEKLDEHKSDMDKRFDKLDNKDGIHDEAISELQTKVARLEERTSVIEEMRQQINDIWKHLMRGNYK